MNAHWLVQLALGLVLLGWIVGCYNRLVRLRLAIVSAWEQIVAALARRSEAMAAVVEAVREPLAAEAATLQALVEADARQCAAADDVKLARARIADVSLWVAAEAALASPASRLRALIELQPALVNEWPQGEKLRQSLAAWRETEPRLAFARQGFNDAADVYNKAIHQWPARLVSSALGFRVAGKV
jgi:LemA protein